MTTTPRRRLYLVLLSASRRANRKKKKLWCANPSFIPWSRFNRFFSNLPPKEAGASTMEMGILKFWCARSKGDDASLRKCLWLLGWNFRLADVLVLTLCRQTAWSSLLFAYGIISRQTLYFNLWRTQKRCYEFLLWDVETALTNIWRFKHLASLNVFF